MVQRKSPIKAKPLRYAGQSLDEEIRNIQDDAWVKASLYTAGFLAMAVADWVRVLTDSPNRPWTSTVIFVIVLVLSIFNIRKMKKNLKALKLGRDGERAVGEYLERLRAKGYAVFHDIVGEGFNIDHVVISPKGIFTVETKTRSKPIRGSAKVIYDGERVFVNGFQPDRNPVVQAKAQARWLQEVLLESTGKKYPVHSVVLFPGWFIEATPSAQRSSTWVLNPKAFPAFIDRKKDVLLVPDLHMASFHLSRFIRSL